MLTVFWGIVVLLVLVVVHELGHFIAARAYSVRVTEFMVGLPGPSIGFTRGETRYGITCIPLGGYNRITGMESGREDPNLESVLAFVYRQGKTDAEHVSSACGISEEDAAFALDVLDGWGSINAPGRENTLGAYAAPARNGYALGQAREVENPKALLDLERSKTYRGLSFPKRLVVLFAGPVMNIALAFVLLLIIFCGIGVSVASTTVSQVEEGGPASQAGIAPGDTIVSVDGTDTPDWTALSQASSSLVVGEDVEVVYERDGHEMEALVTVGANDDGAPKLGIYAGSKTVRLGFVEAMSAMWTYLSMTVQAYVSLFNPATTAETVSQSSSVVGIAVMAEQAASAGIVPLLYLIAIISLSLGVVNLVPIPPLDGGKIVVEVIQRITGREISMKVINAISIVAIAMFTLLFLVLLRQDILNFVLGG